MSVRQMATEYEDPFAQELLRRRQQTTTPKSEGDPDGVLAGGLGAMLGGAGGFVLSGGNPVAALAGAKGGYALGDALGSKTKRKVTAADLDALSRGLGLQDTAEESLSLGGM